MALTTSRWIACVAIVCTLVTAATLGADPPEPGVSMASADTAEQGLQRRVIAAARRWEALVRRDSVVARLGRDPNGRTSAPVFLIDSLLPATHRSVIERTAARQWSSLRIGTARIPVVIAVVVDTIPNNAFPRGGLGQVAYEYVLPADGDASPRCIAIVTLRSRSVVRHGTQGALAELAATQRSASSLLGPCAFFARFGMPGAQIDRWLLSRSYDLLASPRWWTAGSGAGVDTDGATLGERWREANAGAPAVNPIMLTPDALACTAGDTGRCAATLLTDPGADPGAGRVVMMHAVRDAHWGARSERYFSDLVTVMGPDRFERFWRSDLDADAALRAVGGVSLGVWTQQWASGLLGEQRVGPGLSAAELLGAVALAGLSLALAAWGWGRRQVR